MNNVHQFKNRQEAGAILAEKLEQFEGKNAVIYALPRGGVVIGAELAKRLGLPLDLVLARKIGHPLNPEFALGAISESGHLVGEVLIPGRVDSEWLKSEIKKQKEEIKRRRELYYDGRSSLPAKDKIAIIVDDGIATGATMLAAIEEIYGQKPRKVIVAVPVSPPDTALIVEKRVDKFISLLIPDPFLGAIGAYYQQFDQVSDRQVEKMIKEYSNS